MGPGRRGASSISDDQRLEIEQRAQELQQWLGRGGETRRGYYLASALNDRMDDYGYPVPEADRVIEQFLEGYTQERAAAAIFDARVLVAGDEDSDLDSSRYRADDRWLPVSMAYIREGDKREK